MPVGYVPFNARAEVCQLAGNNVDENHQIVCVEVGDAVIRGEDVEDQLVDGVEAGARPDDLGRVVLSVEQQQQLLGEYLGGAGLAQGLQHEVITALPELEVV